MTKEALKAQCLQAIDEHQDAIIRIGQEIFSHPELGFKERRTAELVRSTFAQLRIPFRDHLAITGVRGDLKGRAPGPRVMVMGELDAVVCPLHPQADRETGAAHSCGHNSQIAAMLGAAMGLAPLADQLDGDVAFVAVPAEEYVELEYRERLQQEGQIRFFGGKQELLRQGLLDDIDMGMMIHSHAGVRDRRFLIGCDSSGFLGKLIRFTGREAHAGARPFDGINALNAAALSLLAINSQRETFREKDRIRIHPIITKGGDLVNIVPADVRMETYVRGTNLEAILDASEKVNRSLRGCAYAIGAQVDIQAEFEDTIYTYQALLRQEGIQLSYEPLDELLPPIPGDAERLKQVFCNVLDNAAKHGGAGKRIDAAIRQADNMVVITVRDYGPGRPRRGDPGSALQCAMRLSTCTLGSLRLPMPRAAARLSPSPCRWAEWLTALIRTNVAKILHV